MLDELDDERGTVTEDAVDDVDKVDDVDVLDDVDDLVVTDVECAPRFEAAADELLAIASRAANRGRTTRCGCI